MRRSTKATATPASTSRKSPSPSPGPINKLRATLRSGAGVPCGMRLTGNPGGPGHLWVKARYIDPCPSGFQVITESEELEIEGRKVTVSLDRVFIPNKIGDNMLLMRNDPTYILRLETIRVRKLS